MKPRKPKRRFHLSFESENLAFPEIHTGEVDKEDDSNAGESSPPVQYDNVAVPEIHPGKENEKGEK